APVISPKKTWAGFFGQLAAGTLLGAGAAVLSSSEETSVLDALLAAALGFLLSLFAVVGDLVESTFKRSVAIKDSGGLLPGLGGVVGSAGLESAYEAVRLGKTLALANKETLVVAGEALMAAAKASGAAVLPVDSEHCALHQALRCGERFEVERLVLTASGGPF